jgi:hypothetical protein
MRKWVLVLGDRFLIYGLNLIVANTTGVMLTLYLRAHPELGSGLAHVYGHSSLARLRTDKAHRQEAMGDSQ